MVLLRPFRPPDAGPQPAGHAKQYRRVPDRPAIARQNIRPAQLETRTKPQPPLLRDCPPRQDSAHAARPTPRPTRRLPAVEAGPGPAAGTTDRSAKRFSVVPDAR